MKPTKEIILAKIHSLNTRIENLTFYCPDTLMYLTQRLDIQHCLLSRIEIEEEFAQIDEQFTTQ